MRGAILDAQLLEEIQPDGVAVRPPHRGASEDEAFYERYLQPLESRMLRAVWRVVRDPELARDALQDALTVLWKRRERVRAHPNPEALVLRVCLNAAVDALRKDMRYRRSAQAAAPAHELPGPEPGPMTQLERSELEAQVLRAISRLPPKPAVAVMMRVVEEQPYPAVAEALGCSETTARIHVMRGRARLCRMLAHLAPRQQDKGGAQ